MITIKPTVTPVDISQKISAAFHRSATIDARKVTADVAGSMVTLRGTVRSFAEKLDAEQAAWAAPGVQSVDSRLEIALPEYAFAD